MLEGRGIDLPLKEAVEYTGFEMTKGIEGRRHRGTKAEEKKVKNPRLKDVVLKIA